MKLKIRLENAASREKSYETDSRRVHGLKYEGRSELNRVRRETMSWVLVVHERRGKCNVDSYAVREAH